MKFGPGDVKGYYSNVVKLEVDMPQDEMRNMQMARLATEGPDPILSKETSREKYLKIQSPAKEQQRIDLEWIIGNPAIREALAALLATAWGRGTRKGPRATRRGSRTRLGSASAGTSSRGNSNRTA